MNEISPDNILTVILVLMPGIPGDWIYRLMVGSGWRDSTFDRVTRVLFLSVLGFSIYSFAAERSCLPAPTHALGLGVGSSHLDVAAGFIGWGWIGHLVTTAVLGISSALLIRSVSSVLPVTYADSWDEFVKSHVPEHWVEVRTGDGSLLVGVVAFAATGVRPAERDVILADPYIRDADGALIRMGYDHVFLPADVIESIVTITQDPEARKEDDDA